MIRVERGVIKGRSLRLLMGLVLSWNFMAIPLGHAGNGHLYLKNKDLASNLKYASNPKSFEATESFSRFMSDPIVEELWHMNQKSRLQSFPDQVLDTYFHNHPLFSQLYYMLEKNQGAMLERFMLDQRQQVRLITANSDSESLKVRRLVIDVAKKMGFSPKAIDNMTLFMQIGGSANAFTVSGSIEHIVVSINLEMVHQMHKAQLQAVIAHELHHIAFGHLIKDTLVDIMFAVILESLTTVKSGYSPQTRSYSARNLSAILSEAAWLKPSAKSALYQNKKGFMNMRHQRVKNAKMISQWLQSTLPDVTEELHNDVFDTLIELDEKDRRDLIVQFISIMEKGLRTVEHEVRPEVFDYLNSIQGSLLVETKHSPRFEAEEMLAFFAEIANAFSRWSEVSCDMGAASLVQSLEVASAMSLLVLGDYSTTALDRFRSVKNAQEAFKENQKAFLENPQLLAELVEGTDHPDINMRINTIMEEFPSYPLILFANNFMRLLFLEEVLREAEADSSQLWFFIQMRQSFDEENEKMKKEEAEAAKMAAAEEGKNIGSFARLRKKNRRGIPSEDALKQRIGERRIEVEKEIIRLVIDMESKIQKKEARNVRLDNVFQFMAGRMQYLIKSHRDLAEELPRFANTEDAKIVAIREEIEKRMAEIKKTLAAKNELVEELKKAYTVHPMENSAWEFNSIRRLRAFKKFEDLKPQLESPETAMDLVAKFQLYVTPNAVIKGVTHEDGRPIYARSRITPPLTCKKVLDSSESPVDKASAAAPL